MLQLLTMRNGIGVFVIVAGKEYNNWNINKEVFRWHIQSKRMKENRGLKLGWVSIRP
jgi:hypothetical protein